MQVMTLLGSPRPEGNTAHVLGWVEAALANAGHTVDRHWISDYAVSGCQECQSCKEGTVDLCSVFDDGIALLRTIVKADMLIIAAPVFCWGFPGPLKTLLDRMYCLADDMDGGGDYTTQLAGKPMALVVTAGGPEKDNADLLVKAYEAMVAYMKAVPAGALMVANCVGPQSLDAAVRARAETFGRQLAEITC